MRTQVKSSGLQDKTVGPEKPSTRGNLARKFPSVFSAAIIAIGYGSAGCVYETRHARAYDPPQPAYNQSTLEFQDDYVYYPAYEVYYSRNRRQYTYRDGGSWVSRSTPPRVSARVLLAAPSVTLDFHDSPSAHHAAVIQRYPKHWAPPDQNHGNHEGHNEDRR